MSYKCRFKKRFQSNINIVLKYPVDFTSHTHVDFAPPRHFFNQLVMLDKLFAATLPNFVYIYFRALAITYHSNKISRPCLVDHRNVKSYNWQIHFLRTKRLFFFSPSVLTRVTFLEYMQRHVAKIESTQLDISVFFNQINCL